MPVIEVEHLHKQYGDQVAVDDLSFTVERGEIFGILGPNGAGKTTAVEIIEGLRTPDGGTVRVLGLDPQRDRTELRRRVGAQLQESELPERLKVWEAMDLYSTFYDRPADSERLLDDLGLADKRDTGYGKLSGGQKQCLSIALALVGNPELAVLDELTTGLDPNARRDTWELIEQIRDRGVTVVLVTHFMEEAERLADRVALIDGGRLVAIDSPAGLVSRIDAEQRLRFRPFARRHAWDEAHCRQVTTLALSLFDQMSGLHGLGPAERGLLEVAGLLHDVGYAVSQSAHHKHSLYLIRNADLDGFTARERDLIANVARYHRKALPADRHTDYMTLDDDDRTLVRRLAALLRLADGLDADHFQVVETATVVDQGDHLRLELRARDAPDLAMWAAERNGDLFELEFGRHIELVAVEVA